MASDSSVDYAKFKHLCDRHGTLFPAPDPRHYRRRAAYCQPLAGFGAPLYNKAKAVCLQIGRWALGTHSGCRGRSEHQGRAGNPASRWGARHLWPWMVICALSLLAVRYTCVAADREIESAFLGGSSGFALFGWMAALSAAVILFTIGLARSLTGVLLKCERFRCREPIPFCLGRSAHGLA